MKRMKGAMAALLLSLLMVLPCSAAAKAETKTIDVYARAIRESDAYTAPVEDGEASVKLNDGTSVTVSGVPDSGLWLVVYPVPETEEDAWDWFENCMEAYGTNLYPMEIYFIDQDGNRTEVGGTVTVTVKMPGKYETPIICRLSSDGQAAMMDSSLDGDRITFQPKGGTYYVLAEKKGDSGSGSEKDDGSSTEEASGAGSGEAGTAGSKSPRTGDDSGIWLWAAAFCISAVGAAVALKRRR